MKLDIAINYVCSWLLFLCQFIEACLKILKKTYDCSVFAAVSLAVAFKRKKVDSRLNGITSSSILCSMEDLYRVNKLIRCLIS